MHTSVVVDDQLVRQALALSGLKTEQEAIEEALRLLISVKNQSVIRAFRGKLAWEGDLEKMRMDS